MGIRVQELATFEACARWQSQWNSLVEGARGVTVFSTWEWLSTWWKYYGGGRRLRIFAAFDAERLVGLLPVYQVRRRIVPGLVSREVCLVGAGGDTSPDYLGAVLDPVSETDAAAALAEALLQVRSSWDVLNLTDIMRGPFVDRLVDCLRATGLAARLSHHCAIQVARLPKTWKEYLAAMHRDRRWRVTRLRRGALRNLNIQFDRAETAIEIGVAVEDLITLHRKRWNSKHKPGAFRTDAYVGFHREVIQKCSNQGWVRLYCIRMPTSTVAVLYCYRYRDEILYFQSGFDPTWERFSLGHVLMGFAIESAIAEGAQVFDLLKGEHPYKKTWSNDERHTFKVVAHNHSVPGRVLLLKSKLASIKRAAHECFSRPRTHSRANAVYEVRTD